MHYTGRHLKKFPISQIGMWYERGVWDRSEMSIMSWRPRSHFFGQINSPDLSSPIRQMIALSDVSLDSMMGLHSKSLLHLQSDVGQVFGYMPRCQSQWTHQTLRHKTAQKRDNSNVLQDGLDEWNTIQQSQVSYTHEFSAWEMQFVCRSEFSCRQGCLLHKVHPFCAAPIFRSLLYWLRFEFVMSVVKHALFCISWEYH